MNHMAIRIALFEPDIPQNAGTVLRTAACFDIGVDVIEPCGFVWNEKRLRRSGMDYLHSVDMVRHPSWQKFQQDRNMAGRLILLTTRASVPYAAFSFRNGDTILLGRESAGVPEEVHESVDARILIPMARGMRSLNVAVSAGMVAGEALRQLNAFPKEQ